MPALSFLKKIRTRELPGGHRSSKDEFSSPSEISSSSSSSSSTTTTTITTIITTTTPRTPLSPDSDSPTQPSISTQSSSLSTSSSAPNIELLNSTDSLKQSGTIAGVHQEMTQGVIYQQQYAASAHNLGTPAPSNHNLPGISSIINPPQHDGAAQSRQFEENLQQQQITHTNADATNTNLYAMSSTQLPVLAHGVEEAQPAVKPTKGKYTLNDFKISRTLGTGSFGRVHLVQSRHNSRYYAVKVLKKHQVVKMKQVEHTNDERKMLNEVKHPFLITLWGTFQDSKNLYMVMDFVEGGELFSLLRKSQRFPNPVAKFYAAEVTLAMEYLHKKDIIYRDLKPENLLLDRHGHIKITDFGFAKKVPDITWTLCGTPDYLAPEVVSSKGYNKSVDWWSLGILIFEMLCGFTPFWDGGSPMKIYENILRGKVKYPAYINPDAQDLLQRLITPDLTKRLGNLVNGSADVKNHPWFAEVTWERLYKKDIDAPYVPPVRGGEGDTSQFDKYPEDSEAYGVMGHDEHGKLFTDF